VSAALGPLRLWIQWSATRRDRLVDIPAFELFQFLRTVGYYRLFCHLDILCHLNILCHLDIFCHRYDWPAPHVLE
jgi:hypothetical protein